MKKQLLSSFIMQKFEILNNFYYFQTVQTVQTITSIVFFFFFFFFLYYFFFSEWNSNNKIKLKRNSNGITKRRWNKPIWIQSINAIINTCYLKIPCFILSLLQDRCFLVYLLDSFEQNKLKQTSKREKTKWISKTFYFQLLHNLYNCSKINGK